MIVMMTKEELFLKTVFCCIACDGEIAAEEVSLVREMSKNDTLFCNIDFEKYINSWISEINEYGAVFLQSYLKEISAVDLNENEQLTLVSLAIKAIEADNRIEYAEVKFFKKIRSRLTVSDEAILAEHPDKEEFLLQDVNVADSFKWDGNVRFAQISIPVQN